MTDGATNDVDTSTLLRAMTEQEQRIVADAWRDAAPASTDGVLAAVSINRIAKKRRYLWVLAIGWSLYVVLSVASLRADQGLRLVVALTAYVLAAGLAGWAMFALRRTRHGLTRLASVADPETAAERAQTLRARSG